jgi:hypothetical protein
VRHMTLASSAVRIVFTAIGLMGEICFCLPAQSPQPRLIPTQLAMGSPGPAGPTPPPRWVTPSTRPGSRPQAQGDHRLAEALSRLTPNQRKQLAKAIKKMTPEEREQFAAMLKRLLAGK